MKNYVLVFAAALLGLCACSKVYDEEEVSFKAWFGYDGTEMPDFEALGEPDTTGIRDKFILGDEPAFKGDHFAAQYSSVLTIDRKGDYMFVIKGDDQARLFIDGEEVLSAGGENPGIAVGTTFLSAGKHELQMDYFDAEGSNRLRLELARAGEMPREYNGDGPLEDLPDFVMAEADSTYQRFAAWKGDDEVIAFPILTDLHSEERYSYQHIGYIVKTDELFDYDFMVNLGDIGINNGPGHVSQDYVRMMVGLTVTEMKKFDGVFLYAAGNHDWDAGEGEYNTGAFLSETFQKPALEHAGGNLHLTPDQVYCYYDIPEKDARVIILNSEGTGTQNGCYYIFDDAQIEWFRSVMDSTSPETNVIVMCHYLPHPIGRWNNTPDPVTLESNNRMMSILAEYRMTHNVVGLFCGDSHVNAHETLDNVNYFVSQSYGWCADHLMMEGQKHAYFDYRECLCCDVIAVKPSTREVRTFRIGAGAEEYDYAFGY